MDFVAASPISRLSSLCRPTARIIFSGLATFFLATALCTLAGFWSGALASSQSHHSHSATRHHGRQASSKKNSHTHDSAAHRDEANHPPSSHGSTRSHPSHSH